MFLDLLEASLGLLGSREASLSPSNVSNEDLKMSPPVFGENWSDIFSPVGWLVGAFSSPGPRERAQIAIVRNSVIELDDLLQGPSSSGLKVLSFTFPYWNYTTKQSWRRPGLYLHLSFNSIPMYFFSPMHLRLFSFLIIRRAVRDILNKLQNPECNKI